MAFLELKLCDIFDRHNTLTIPDGLRHGIEQRCLPCAGPARNNDIQTAFCSNVEKFSHVWRHGTIANQYGQFSNVAVEFSDRKIRPVHRERWEDDVDPAAVQ